MAGEAWFLGVHPEKTSRYSDALRDFGSRLLPQGDHSRSWTDLASELSSYASDDQVHHGPIHQGGTQRISSMPQSLHPGRKHIGSEQESKAIFGQLTLIVIRCT